MGKPNYIINLEILNYLNSLVKLTDNGDIIWHWNNDEPASYVTDNSQDPRCDLFYKLTISCKETIIDDGYSYDLLITSIDYTGNKITNNINKYAVKDSNPNGLSKQVDEILKKLYTQASVNVYDKNNQQVADLLENVLNAFSKLARD